MIVHALVTTMGIMSPNFSNTRRIQVVNPTRATYKDLAVYHSRDYLDFVLNPRHSIRELPVNSHGAHEKFGLEDVRRDSLSLLSHLTKSRIALYFQASTITCR